MLLLFIAEPMAALMILGILGLAAAAVAAWECRLHSFWLKVFVPGLVLLAIFMPAEWTGLKMSEYKDLSQSLEVLGAEVAAQRSSPLGLVQVLRNERVPFRYAPGLSLAAPSAPPEQLGVFNDGDQAGAITRFTGAREPLSYLDYLGSALPYHLLDRPRVLVLGAGGGAEVLQALYHQARRVDAVELNPQIVDLVRNEFADFAGGLYDRPRVRVYTAEARGFVAGSRERYDLIQVALLDAFSATAAGLYALSESYLYTVEAFGRYLERLEPGGLLAVTRWLHLPPRDSLKLFATAATALGRAGVADPGARLALIRGWKTTTLLLKNGRFDDAEIAVLRRFCRERSFDVVWYPGIAAAEVNRFNLLKQPFFYEGARAILGSGRADFFRRYKFDLRPATDDRPYFFHFFKWRALPELLRLRARSGLGQLEWGYLVLLATLAQALVAALVLILLPLLRRRPAAAGARRRVLGYFLAIGLAFLFLEIAFIQKFILFLSHPLYAVAVAVAVVLCAFLVFAGLGSGCSRRLQADSQSGRTGSAALYMAVAGIVGLSLLYSILLPPFFAHALAWPGPVKIVCTVALIAPLAFCMGMPFPLGLARVAAAAPRLLPWAWAINGCASVVSAVLATLLALRVGFSGVIVAALALYIAAVVTAPRSAAG